MNKDDFKPDKPKRHRRTKKELEEAGYYDRKNGGEKVENTHKNSGYKLEDFLSQKQELDKKNQKLTEDIKENLGRMKTIAEVCEEQIQRAKDKNLPQPDFDYRNSYEKGQIIYYIDVNELIGKKQLLELKISSVYPRAIIAYEDKGMGYTIGYEDEDMIFSTRKEADSVFSNITVENKLEEYFQIQKQLANKRRLEREANANG